MFHCTAQFLEELRLLMDDASRVLFFFFLMFLPFHLSVDLLKVFMSAVLARLLDPFPHHNSNKKYTKKIVEV